MKLGHAQYGRAWSKVAQVVGTRNRAQTRSHGEKWLRKRAPQIPVFQGA